MRDVATMAGVGIATVSRVVNGKPVTPDLAERVTRAAELLGYRHDLTASSLRRADRRTHTLGLVLEDAANPSPPRCTARWRTPPPTVACWSWPDPPTRTRSENTAC
ncbi:LacI family DNA-binding transcriptional regulator [Streptomyces sp. Li-HN-5-13]|nr:LacI family DNA-binding transcriptional regulator [Streptomyces sp. Li-HN-5-13]